MREILTEIVRQTVPLFEKIRVTGTDEGVKVEAHTEDKMLFLVAELKEPIKEFTGEFGMGNLSTVNGFLNFPSYKANDAKFIANRTERDGVEYLSEFEFRDAHGGGHARYRTMNPRMVGDQAKIASIPWEVSVVPSKTKIAEFVQLAGLLSDVEKQFSVRVENGTMFLTIGGTGTASHSANVAFVSDVAEKLPQTNMVFKVAQFLSVLKTAGNYPVTVRFSSRGVGGVVVDTGNGTYNYILRATEG